MKSPSIKKYSFILIFIIFLTANITSAQDSGINFEQIYSFPEIAPATSCTAGYRFAGYDNSKKAGEYEYLHNSISAGGEIRLFPFPHRIHLNINVKNRKDYFGDLSYAYRDIVLFRGINRTLFHNLDNIYYGRSPAVSFTEPTDAGEEYGVSVGISNVFVRFKTPHFPFHVYANGSLIKKDGLAQQRFLGGAGYFTTTVPFPFANGRVRTTQKRDIDWKTTEYTIGANGHLRWIEADISHTEKRFDSSGDKVMYYTYLPAGAPTAGSVRQGGTYPHNLNPNLRGSTNTLKLHSSYTGKIVASATFLKKDRENEYSHAKAGYFSGAGNITWMPLTKLIFFIKYKHTDRNIDNPVSVTIADLNNAANTYSDTSVRPSISSHSDMVSLTGRYRPVSRLTLRANYTFRDHRRSDNKAWGLPHSTQKNIFSISGDSRIMAGLALKAGYTHKSINDPAYNVQPDRSDEGRLSISWLPVSRISAILSYGIAIEKRDHMRFAEGPGVIIESPGNRKVRRDNLLGNVSFLIIKELSLTTSYAYMHHKIKEDVFYHNTIPPFTDANRKFDRGVPYSDTANSYAVNIRYRVNDKLNLNGGVTHTRSRAHFNVAAADLTQPVSVASFSSLETRETSYSISGSYTVIHGFLVGAEYRYSDFNDVRDDPYDDVKDSKVHIIWLTLSKKWG
ncbi:hypothetical protein BMS3Abin07_00554 [bacterium BMS3Abin07]|nr:hypothetical protein BMS3Abin07_00554 [bacterium BMS3Abin07]GBE32838.1 hypothetical protein BMS3Bbin05_01766 [bacterium BMS3Bbin05]